MIKNDQTRWYLYLLGIIVLVSFAVVMLLNGEQIEAMIGLVSILLGIAMKNVPSGSEQ